ncbi:universal stress protein [Halopenitus sp. POP-27]|uniref:universal stress protein n=1 Tax=Halopenitus sp. POP-27 TaxID=2994425 RepID=UPI0024687058|nr:universal stress protein [Halopenitus sp. POP-27]
MSLYARILVPTDGSPEGERAVEHALRLAAIHDAEVHALYVINVSSYAGLPMESSWDGIDDLLKSDADAAVEEVQSIADGVGVDVPVETAVVEGSPSREIIDYAEGQGCDVIVMGTHGRGGIDRLLLGSVAEKVVRGSSIPVLTVRLGEAGDTAASNAAETAGVAGSTETPETADADANSADGTPESEASGSG